MFLPNPLNTTENSSSFLMSEGNLEFSSSLLSISDDSENRPNLSDIYGFQDIYPPIWKGLEGETSQSSPRTVLMKANDIDTRRKDNLVKKFKITKKRGKPKNKESKKAEHNALSIDNIERKIQIHFFNFIVSFLNDCVHTFFGYKKFTFKKFPYSEKIKISREHMKELKNSNIKYLFENIDISEKYKHYDKNINKMNLKALSGSEYDWFQQIFEIKYLDLFFDYYNDEQPLEEMTIFGKKIILSPETQSFYYLLQKKKNKDLGDEMINVAKKIYLNDSNFIFGLNLGGEKNEI